MKNIICIISIVALLLSLLSCQSKNELEGIWMGAYTLRYTDTDSTFNTMNLLFDISEDEIIMKNFAFHRNEMEDSEEHFKYSLEDNRIVLQSTRLKSKMPETLLIEKIDRDSLILKNLGEENLEFCFKRIENRTKKINPIIQPKAYRYASPFLTDSLDFINDSTVLHIGSVFDVSRVSDWKIDTYKNLEFLLIDRGLISIPIMLIEYDSRGTIGLKYYHENIYKSQLEYLEYQKDIGKLVGNWKAEYPKFFECDDFFSVNITKDSISINNFENRTITHEKLQLNSTNEFIYFPNNRYQSVWKILNLNDSTLTIKRGGDRWREGAMCRLAEDIVLKRMN